MEKELEKELLRNTTIEDISEKYRVIVELVGIGNMMQISKYLMGDKLYFPKPDSIIRQARNRKILEEYNGYNEVELAKRFDLSVSHIKTIVKDSKPKADSIMKEGRNRNIPDAHSSYDKGKPVKKIDLSVSHSKAIAENSESRQMTIFDLY